jgi:hypothetical protein
MVDNAIRDLEIHKKNITTLILIADADKFQINKIGLNGATTEQLMALVGTLEMFKLSLIDTIQNGDGFVEDGDEVPEEFVDEDEDEDDGASKDKKVH